MYESVHVSFFQGGLHPNAKVATDEVLTERLVTQWTLTGPNYTALNMTLANPQPFQEFHRCSDGGGPGNKGHPHEGLNP